MKKIKFNFFKKWVISLFVLMLCSGLTSYGQNIVSGIVTDGAGFPLAGTNVIEKGTTNGTQSDFNGYYSISVTNTSILSFSYLGFVTKEVLVGDKLTIDISLSEDSSQLDEVVIVGYGQQKVANLTGAVSMVSSETIENRPVQNTAQALQGQIPGLTISQTNGSPGDEGLNISIRGINSFGSNNSPLVLIDGVEGNLEDLDPTWIESVNVLKDASSAAIYGLRAANGVILVQTKTGGKEAMTISYDGSYAFNSPSMLPNMITNSADFMDLYNRSLITSKGSATGGYPQNVIDAYRNAKNDPLYPNTDWTDLLTQTGTVIKNTIGINGTSGKTTYNLSLNSWNQEGLMVKSNYNKKNVFLNFRTAIRENISVGGAIIGLASDRKGPEPDSNTAFTKAWETRPNWGPYTLDGTGHYAAKAFSGSDLDPDGLIFDEGFTRVNPMIETYGQNGYSDKKHNFNGNLFANAKILNNLVLDVKGAYKYDYTRSTNQKLQHDEYNYRTGEYLRTTRDPSEISVGNLFSKLTTFYSTLTYNKMIENHDFKVMAGYSQEARRHEWTNSTRFGVPSQSIIELDGVGTANQLASGSSTESSVRSAFSRINYSYDDKYLLEFNFRTDESSRFEESNRRGYFPSLSVGWRLEREPFIQKIDFISQLKLRASWGKLGNDGSNDYPYQSRYEFGDPNVKDYVNTHSTGSHSYPFGTGISTGVALEKFTNSDISWETTTISDIGLDFTSKNRLIFVNVDYYHKVTSNILRQLQVSVEAGAAGPQVNQGEMKNTGWDIVIGHNNNIGDFSFKVSSNFSWYKNKLVKYGATEIGGQTVNEEGYPFRNYYMYESNGYFNTAEDIANAPTQPLPPYLGGIRLKDQNGDNIIDQNDRIHIGGQHPSLLYGANISGKYKNIEISTFWQGVTGMKTYRNWAGVEPFLQDGNAPSVWITDSWTPENQNTKLPAVYNEPLSSYGATQYINSFWLMNSSYLRMKNIMISYSVPNQFIEYLKLKSAQLYFSGDNLFTLTKDNLFNLDPEITASSTYPISKSYTFGIKLTF